MSRKRIELGKDAEARIALGITRGESVAQVAKATAIPPRTVARRMREIRGPMKAPRAGAKTTPQSAPTSSHAPPLPTSPDDIPEGASLPELKGLLDRCKSALTQAETDENLPLVGQMIRVAAQLSETIRKATPPKQADPNDAPDMVALRTEAARRWHEMIDLVADG